MIENFMDNMVKSLMWFFVGLFFRLGWITCDGLIERLKKDEKTEDNG